MKKFNFLLLFLFIISISLFSQVHSVYIEITNNVNVHPDSVSFYAWISGREADVITLDSPACYYYTSGEFNGALQIQVFDFYDGWQPQDTLMVEVYSNLGNGLNSFVLHDNANAQFFGEMFDEWSEGDGITVNYTPNNFHADFSASPLTGTAPLTVHFVNQSIGEYSLSYWDFQNNTSYESTETNPTYTYYGPGTYDVRLFIYGNGYLDEIIKNSYITVLPESSSVSVNSISNKQILTNYPNPFNPNTTINYNLSKNSQVLIKIFNIKGETVKTFNIGFQKSGFHTVEWNGKSDSNQKLASGLYFYSLFVNNQKKVTQKMILLK